MAYNWSAGEEITADKLNQTGNTPATRETELLCDGDIAAGRALVIGTDGRARVAGASALGSPSSALTDSTRSWDGDSIPKAFTVSSTIKALFFRDGTDIYLAKITHNGVDASAIAFTQLNTTAGIDDFDVVQLSSNTFFVLFWENTADAAIGRIVTAVDTTPSLGSEATVATGVPDNKAKCAKISSTEVVVFYGDETTSIGYYKPCTISGTTITPGTQATFQASISRMQVYAAHAFGDSGYVIVGYYNGTNHVVQIGLYSSVSHTFTSIGSAATVEAAPSGGSHLQGNWSIAGISDTRCVIAYTIQSTSQKVVSVSRSGTTATVSAATTLSATIDTLVNFIQIGEVVANSNIFAVCYSHDGGATESFRVQLVYVDSTDGSVDLVGSAYDHNVDNEKCAIIAPWNDSSYVNAMLMYTDTGTTDVVTVKLPLTPQNTIALIGISAEAGDDGSAIDIDTFGSNELVSGLTPGTTYYAGPGGFLTTSTSGVRVGPALAADKVLIIH